MSREAYVAPTFQTQTTSIEGPTTQYLCGECNAKVQLKKGDPLRCKDCGHRVLYKERTKRYAQPQYAYKVGEEEAHSKVIEWYSLKLGDSRKAEIMNNT